MFVLLLALAVLSPARPDRRVHLAARLAEGRTTRRSGRDVGAEIMTGMGEGDEDGAIPLV